MMAGSLARGAEVRGEMSRSAGVGTVVGNSRESWFGDFEAVVVWVAAATVVVFQRSVEPR